MKVLISGGEGFVGSHLKTEFWNNGYEVISCDLLKNEDAVYLDIMNQRMIRDVLNRFHPDVLVNLAGQANVGVSWSKPQLTIELNTIGFVNVLEAVKEVDPNIRVVAVGSSDQYGVLDQKGMDVKEDIETNPVTPYAISKQAQELFARAYCKAYGMTIYMVRLFNLGGSGQAKGFMISDFSSGIAEVEQGISDHVSVGNLACARDFTHVKDACRAIRLVAERGHTGEVYNICSGKTYTAEEVLNKLLYLAKKEVRIEQDVKRMRPSDSPIICGNHEKVSSHTGWEPQFGIDTILLESLEYWRMKIKEKK